MKNITCMIVEDEPVSQEILKRYIDDCPVLKLVATCNHAIEALQQLRLVSPDLLFLDITMPKVSGLDFYKSLLDPPYVIFTTAYPQYAVNGFEVDAVDYLVKPFPFDRFLKAVNKLQDILSSLETTYQNYILLQSEKKIHKVNVDEILFLEAMGDYVKVFLPEKILIVHQTLQKLQDQLPKIFFRIHKSFVISLNKLELIEGNMVSISKHQIPIGQTYKNEFMSVLQRPGKDG